MSYSVIEMGDKRQLNVRIPAELMDKLDALDRSKQDVIVDALQLYFDSNMQQNSSNLIACRSEVDFLRGQLRELTQLLHQEQALHLTTQRQLYGDSGVPGEPGEQPKKPWWMFWYK